MDSSISEDFRKTLGGIESEMSELLEKVEKRIQELDIKEKHWNELEEKISKCIEDLPKKIVLDVGGTKFAASKDTFLSQKGTFFECLLASGNWKPDANGEYFIDRSPMLFPIVMEYLRTGYVDVQSLSPCLIDKLAVEFDFYQISFQLQLQTIPQRTVFSESAILSDKSKAVLTDWVGDKQTLLLYRASRDGYQPSSFHFLCDNKGPTLVVIKSHHGHVFGGYAAQSWDNSILGRYLFAAGSFVFTLSNPHGIEATKFHPVHTNQAMFCHDQYGPSFGNDMIIGCGPMNPPIFASFHFPSVFADSTNKGKFLFTGEPISQLHEIEVFQIQQ